MNRAPVDKPLQLKAIPVTFLNGVNAKARAEGNNAGWHCQCGDSLPLVGRCYYQFGDTCFTVCPACGRRYRVEADDKKRAREVKEIAQ